MYPPAGVGGAEVTITAGTQGGTPVTVDPGVAGMIMSGTMVGGQEVTSGTMVGGQEVTSGTMIGGQEVPEVVCDRVGVNIEDGLAIGNGLQVTYTGLVGLEGERVMMSLNLANGPSAPGEYSLDEIPLRDCELCLSAYSNCEGEVCKTLYGSEGVVELIEVGAWGRTQLQARLQNIVFKEYTELTSQGSEVSGGLTWCVPDLTIDLPVFGPVNGPCDTEVACLGESVYDYELISCASESPVSAHSLMDTGDLGIWMALGAAWSNPSFPGLSRRQQLSDQGVHAIYVLGEGERGQSPTIAQCLDFSTEHNIPLELLYLDYTEEGAFRNTFSRMWSYHDHDSNLSLPIHLMVRSGAYGYEFVYARGAERGDYEEGLNLLTQP